MTATSRRIVSFCNRRLIVTVDSRGVIVGIRGGDYRHRHYIGQAYRLFVSRVRFKRLACGRYVKNKEESQ
jgi:hypothetical protein